MSALPQTAKPKQQAQASSDYSSELAQSSSYQCSSGQFQASEILIGYQPLNDGQRLIKSLNDLGVQVLVSDEINKISTGEAVFLTDINSIVICKVEYERIISNDHYPDLTHEAEHAYCHHAALCGSSKALVEMSYLLSSDPRYPACIVNEIQARLDQIPMILNEKADWATDRTLSSVYFSTVLPSAKELARTAHDIDLGPIMDRFETAAKFLEGKSLESLIYDRPLNDAQKHRLLSSKINYSGQFPTVSLELDLTEFGGGHETLGLRLPIKVKELQDDQALVFKIAEDQLSLFVQRIKDQRNEYQRMGESLA